MLISTSTTYPKQYIKNQARTHLKISSRSTKKTYNLVKTRFPSFHNLVAEEPKNSNISCLYCMYSFQMINCRKTHSVRSGDPDSRMNENVIKMAKKAMMKAKQQQQQRRRREKGKGKGIEKREKKKDKKETRKKKLLTRLRLTAPIRTFARFYNE